MCYTVVSASDRPVNKTGKDLLSWNLHSNERKQTVSKYIVLQRILSAVENNKAVFRG